MSRRLSEPQRALLVALVTLGQPTTAGGIAPEVGTASSASVARTANVLCEHGLVEIVRMPGGSTVAYALTAAGLRVAAGLVTA